MGPVAAGAGAKSAPAAVSGSDEREIPLAYAEPISPATLRSFPHLADLQGHVLLGGRTAQVVLSGVPANGSADPWQPALVAAYERQGGAWRPLGALGAVDVRSGGSGPLYVPAGINLGLDAERGIALASVVYAARGSAPGGSGKLVSFRLDAVGNVLDVQLDETSAAWSLRFRSLVASDVAGPEVAVGSQRGSRYLLRYRQAEVAAFVGHRLFTVMESTAGTVLEPLGDEAGSARPSREGFELLLGRMAAGRLHARVAALEACLPAARSARKPAAASCEAAPPASVATLTLKLPAEDGGGRHVPHPVHLFDQTGRELSYTALYAGESMALQLPVGQPLYLADTRLGRALGDGKPLLLAPGDAPVVALAQRAAGRLAVALGASEAAPAIVTLHRLDAPGGDAYDLGAKTPAGVLRLGPAAFWVTLARLELPVLAGSYRVEGRSGDAGGACSARVAVPRGGSGAARCVPSRGSAPRRDAGIDVDLASGAWPIASQAMRRALGLDWVAIRPGDASGQGAVPALTVADPGTGLTLQLVPAQAPLAAAWARESRALRGADLLARFAAFVRGSGSAAGRARGLLELGCPTAGVDLAEYETLAQRLGVDAVRLFGCREGLASSELMSLYARLHVRRQGRLLLTSASALDLAAVGPYYPRLVLDRGAVPTATPEGLLAGLRAHDYTLSSGALVGIGGLSAAGARAGRRRLTMEVEIAVDPDIRVRELIIHTEAGPVHREPLGEGAAQNTAPRRLELEIPQGSRWIRAELRGASRRFAASQLFDRTGGLLLSTTTFQALPK